VEGTSLDLRLEAPPDEWVTEHARLLATRPIPDLDYELHAMNSDLLVIVVPHSPVRWTAIPERAHLHLTDAAFDIVLDALAELTMSVKAMVNWEQVEAMSPAERGRFISEDSGAPGIPEFKLNDVLDWLVTPREIGCALRTYAKHPAPERAIERLLGPEVLPLWRRWLAYLELASGHGGFRTALDPEARIRDELADAARADVSYDYATLQPTPRTTRWTLAGYGRQVLQDPGPEPPSPGDARARG
jgi:hypothetical protein